MTTAAPDGWARLLAMIAKNTAERPERHAKQKKEPRLKKPKQGELNYDQDK